MPANNYTTQNIKLFQNVIVEFKLSCRVCVHTLQTVNHGTEGNHQVTTRAVTWRLPRKVGKMV